MALRIVDPGAQASFDTNFGPSAVLSPDGTKLAFVGGDGRIYVRKLDAPKAEAVPRTEGARDPFFSPDGLSIAFFTDTQLKKVAVSGGPVTTLCDAETARGGWWASDNAIWFATLRSTILRVSASGGKPEPLTKLNLDEREVTHRWPQSIDNGGMILFTANMEAGNFEQGFGVLQDLRTGRRRVIHRNGYHYRYIPGGYLVFMSQAGLFSVPLDLRSMETSGELVRLFDDVSSQPQNGGAQLSFSANGTLLYVSGEVRGKTVINWIDRAGKTTPLLSKPDYYFGLSLSPDGQSVAFGLSDGRQSSIGVYHPKQGEPRSLTATRSSSAPLWSGNYITYRTENTIMRQRADGMEVAQRLTLSNYAQVPDSWDPTGKILALRQYRGPDRNDILTIRIGDNAKEFLATSANEFGAAFSRDGRWTAYTSDGSGRNQVYVRPSQRSGDPWLVSKGGGMLPVWTQSELLYRARDGQIMIAAYTVRNGRFESESPREWPNARPVDLGEIRSFDTDGKRLAVIDLAPESRNHRLVMVTNFR